MNRCPQRRQFRQLHAFRFELGPKETTLAGWIFMSGKAW